MTSLPDDNVIRIADDVTRLIGRYVRRSHEHERRHRPGTTLAPHRDPARRALWPHLRHLAAGEGDEDLAERARRLEVVLDLLSRRLAALAADAPELSASGSWPCVQAVVHALGHPRG